MWVRNDYGGVVGTPGSWGGGGTWASLGKGLLFLN